MYPPSMMISIRNVNIFREHIELIPICYRKGVTLGLKSWFIFTKDDKQFIKDEKGIYHYKDYVFEIKDGWFICGDLKFELSQRTNISTFERFVLALGIPLPVEDKDFKIDLQKVTIKIMFHMLTMLALKDLNVISGSFSLQKQRNYGKNVFESYLLSVTGSGNIKAKHENIRWLNEEDTLQLKAQLFTTTGYQSGVRSMRYEATDLANSIFEKVFEYFDVLEFKETEIHRKPLDFNVTIDLLKRIRLRDVILLLGDCVGYKDGFIIRPEITDIQYSRVYSVFTSISSDTRKILGFNNYDIGTALQTICLQLVDDPSKYPLHQELVYNKEAFRAKIQRETDKDLDWVKTELSKIDNLENMPNKYNKYPTLKMYFDEAQILRKEIINTAEPVILQNAKDLAKIKWRKIWLMEKKAYNFIPDGKKESSIFFFIWTQWERQIRESMMNCFDEPVECHQVHDAVYSKQIIDPKIIEKKVLEDTGFKVQISTD